MVFCLQGFSGGWLPVKFHFARKTVSLRVRVEAGGIGAILKVRATEAVAAGRYIGIRRKINRISGDGKVTPTQLTILREMGTATAAERYWEHFETGNRNPCF